MKALFPKFFPSDLSFKKRNPEYFKTPECQCSCHRLYVSQHKAILFQSICLLFFQFQGRIEKDIPVAIFYTKDEYHYI